MSINVGEIVVSGADNGIFSVASGSAAPIARGTAGPIPSPSPSASPTLQIPGYGAVPLPTLSPSTTYTVTYHPPESALKPCIHQEPGPIGNFTTTS